MLIFVKTLPGKKLDVEVQPSTTVEELKEMIQGKDGVPPIKQIVVFAGKKLEDGRVLADYNIEEYAVLHVVYLRDAPAAAARGGGGGDDPKPAEEEEQASDAKDGDAAE